MRKRHRQRQRIVSVGGVRMSESSRLSYIKALAKEKKQRQTLTVGMPLMRWDVVNFMLGKRGRFLEIGVSAGTMGRQIKADELWGVDPAPVQGSAKFYTKLIETTSDLFFANLSSEEKFDVIFIDGLHHAEQVYRDVLNSVRHLRTGGVVVMHDCNPQSEKAQRVPQCQSHWNGDCWKAIAELRSRHPELTTCVVDHDEGLGVVMPTQNKGRSIDLPDSAFDLTYETLEARRSELLGIMSWNEAMQLYKFYSMPKKLTVVTALYGPRFSLHEPTVQMSDCEFICFTDRSDLRSERWIIKNLPLMHGNRRNNRHVKALLHRYVNGVTFYIDSEYQVVGDLRTTIGSALRCSAWAATEHPDRHCPYEEAKYCLNIGRVESPSALKKQIDRYQSTGLPQQYGLWAGGTIARNEDSAAEKLGESWWEEIESGSERDQISLAYVSWRLGLKPGLLPGSYNKISGLMSHPINRDYQ